MFSLCFFFPDIKSENLYFTLTHAALFSHPDYTVGTGITPVQPCFHGSRTIPPVGNHTPPRRIILKFLFIITHYKSTYKYIFYLFFTMILCNIHINLHYSLYSKCMALSDHPHLLHPAEVLTYLSVFHL